MDKYTAYENRSNRNNTIGGISVVIFILILIYVIATFPSKVESRLNNLDKLNYECEAEVIKITEVTGGSQGYEGGQANLAGYSVYYKYFYKGVLYNNVDFIPPKKGFDNMIARILKLKKYDIIQIKIDTINPDKSLIRFIEPPIQDT